MTSRLASPGERSVGWRLLCALVRAFGFVLVVMVGVTGAKVAQFAAADYLGPALGFDVASAAGVAPVLLFYFWIAHRLSDRNRAKGACR